MKDNKLDRSWVDCGNGNGFWVTMTGEDHPHRLPFFCPYELCQRPTSNLDDPFLLEFGFCQLCHTLFVDSRQTPAIDLEKYKPKKKPIE